MSLPHKDLIRLSYKDTLYEESLLTLLEQRYAINILQRHGYTIVNDCESGCLYIRES